MTLYNYYKSFMFHKPYLMKLPFKEGITFLVVTWPCMNIPYLLDQTPRLLFTSSPAFVRCLFGSGDYSRVAFINTSS